MLSARMARLFTTSFPEMHAAICGKIHRSHPDQIIFSLRSTNC